MLDEVGDVPRDGHVAGHGQFLAGEEGFELAEERSVRLRLEQGDEVAEEGDPRRSVGVGRSVQPRGGEDVQPVAAVEPRDLRGVEQAGPVHVVEEEQAAVRCAGVGEFLQLAAGVLELEVGVFLFVVGELEADGRGEFGKGEAQVVLERAAHLPAFRVHAVGPPGGGAPNGFKHGLGNGARAWHRWAMMIFHINTGMS